MNNKKILYESIMKSVAKQVKKVLNEAFDTVENLAETVKNRIIESGIKLRRRIIAGKKTWVIYKDEYHGKLHIASIDDMIESIILCKSSGLYGDDYEDINPNSIIATFEYPDEAAEYALELVLNEEEYYYFNKSMREIGFSETMENYNNLLRDKLWEKFYDSPEFIGMALSNDIDDVIDYETEEEAREQYGYYWDDQFDAEWFEQVHSKK